MKIMIVAGGYPSKREPQWGCFERDQAYALKNLGHEVSIIYVDMRFRTYWRKIGITHITDNGIEICGIFLFPFLKLSSLSKNLHFYIVGKMLDCVFRSITKRVGIPDVIYAHYLSNIAFSTVLKEKYHIPLVGIEHWSELTKEHLRPIVRFRGNIAYHKTDKLLAVSKSLQSHIKKHFDIDSTVVYDMLGPEFVNSEIVDRNKEKKGLRGKFTFIAIGSLIYRKGFDLLLDAFSKSRLYEKDCRVTIIGDGPEKTNLLSQAKNLGIADEVHLVGRKNKKEIIQLLNESNVFVLPSRAETFGVVCIESLSQGLPNIATICGGPEEFVTERNGILVSTNNADAIADAMVKMYNTYESYIRTEITEGCIRQFAPSVIALQLTGIFEEVTTKNSQ